MNFWRQNYSNTTKCYNTISVTFFSKHLCFLFWRNLFKAASLGATRSASTPLLLVTPVTPLILPFPATPLPLSMFVTLAFKSVVPFCPLLPLLLPKALPFKLRLQALPSRGALNVLDDPCCGAFVRVFFKDKSSWLAICCWDMLCTWWWWWWW